MTDLPVRKGYCDGLWGQVHYREMGEEGGPPVLLLHQTPWSLIQFEHVQPLLASAGNRVIAIDTPGYGQSDPPTEQPEIGDYADNLVAVLDSLGLDRVVLLGHHTGALIAGCFAARRGDRVAGLVLDNAPFYDDAEREERLARRERLFFLSDDGSHFTKRWSYLRTVMDPDAGLMTVHQAVISYFAREHLQCHGHSAAYRYRFEDDLAAIGCPTLVMANRHDPIFSSGARILARRPEFATAELAMGSSAAREHPESWAGVVAPFLALCRATAGN